MTAILPDNEDLRELMREHPAFQQGAEQCPECGRKVASAAACAAMDRIGRKLHRAKGLFLELSQPKD